MAVLNADHVDIEGNTVHDNRPAVDPATLQFPAAGLALPSLPGNTCPAGIPASVCAPDRPPEEATATQVGESATTEV